MPNLIGWLPAYQGMYPAVWPIINGEKFAGVTLHMIDWGIDTGDIIDQTEVNIGEKDTARELYFSCMESAITLLDRRFGSLLNCDYTTYTQPSTGSSYYPPISADSSMFNLVLRQTADSIIRQSKAFHFREYQIPKIGHMPITNGVILDARSKGAAGKYVFYESETVVVSTIDYDVRFERDRSWDFHQFVNNSDVPGINNYPHEKNVVDVTNVNGWTPLMVAAYNGKIDICNALIKAGANVNATNQNGTTVLMYAKDYAVSAHDFSICELLLDAGADLHAADRFGRNLNDYVRMSNSLIAKKFFGER